MFVKLDKKYYWSYPKHQKWGNINYVIQFTLSEKS